MARTPKFNLDKSFQKKSLLQEKKIAKEFRGKTVSGSGRGFIKGDVDLKDYKIECKQTEKESYTLKLSTLQKIKREASLEDKKFAMIIEIDGFEIAVIAKKDLIDLLNFWIQVNSKGGN